VSWRADSFQVQILEDFEECLMLRRGVDSLLGVVLVAAMLPIVFLAALRLRLRRDGKGRRGADAENVAAAKPTVGEFEFERAVEAYEALIDAVIAENRGCTLRK
jgi:hypothetical protein